MLATLTYEQQYKLLSELTARLQYGVKVVIRNSDGLFHDTDPIKKISGIIFIGNNPMVLVYGIISPIKLEDVRPFLRLGSDFSDSERQEYEMVGRHAPTHNEIYHWCYAHHTDTIGMIANGIAFRAPRNLYSLPPSAINHNGTYDPLISISPSRS